jgi:transcriptional antiterminator NusG
MGMEEPRPKIQFKVGQSVRIISGPFNDLIGTVQDIMDDKSKVRVTVSMFGRETPLELDYYQIQELD